MITRRSRWPALRRQMRAVVHHIFKRWLLPLIGAACSRRPSTDQDVLQPGLKAQVTCEQPGRHRSKWARRSCWPARRPQVRVVVHHILKSSIAVTCLKIQERSSSENFKAFKPAAILESLITQFSSLFLLIPFRLYVKAEMESLQRLTIQGQQWTRAFYAAFSPLWTLSFCCNQSIGHERTLPRQ